LLHDRNHFTSRAKAQQAIKAGYIVAQDTGVTLRKPSMLVPDDIALAIRQDELPFVSRGGLKLAAALEIFDIDCTDKIVLDIGASTGGFTDVVLRAGAKCVYALDVGTEQLADELRNDQRVISIEQMNVRAMDVDLFTAGMPELIVTDVSFISLTYVLDKLQEIFSELSFDFVGLIKPQFELDKRKIGKKGVIRDRKLQQAAVKKIEQYIETFGASWHIVGIIPAPITGTKGNQEFLIYVKKR